ncbi:MAG: DUF484 family protein [Xanthomonadales bacterium]|nr:DUF484 family protein [Xanthomonadales bacterium]
MVSENKSSLSDVVAAFLRKNPDFLKDYPDVLDVLNLPHASGAASSLIERQVRHLRSQNFELSRQLNRLVHVASENEQLMSRLHQLTLELLSIAQPAEFFQHLTHSLKQDFKADSVKVFLFDPDLAAMAGQQAQWLDRNDEPAKLFHNQLSQDHTTCGRMNESKLSILFDATAQWVKSTALVPIGQGGQDGMLAIGSSDPGRFYPGMGTLFLDLLADVIASSLANVEPEEQRRSA